jgi:phage terminase Nu1 subunit (DNA packaging protein)
MANRNDRQPPFMTATDLAHTLNCSLAAVRDWTRKGLPYLPAGRLRRYDLGEVIQWLRERDRAKHPARADGFSAKRQSRSRDC